MIAVLFKNKKITLLIAGISYFPCPSRGLVSSDTNAFTSLPAGRQVCSKFCANIIHYQPKTAFLNTGISYFPCPSRGLVSSDTNAFTSLFGMGRGRPRLNKIPVYKKAVFTFVNFFPRTFCGSAMHFASINPQKVRGSVL